MSEAYLVGLITIKDLEQWSCYREQVPATLAPWGAELIFRGRKAAVLAGHMAHDDIVVARFPDRAAAEAWFASAAYQALIPLRHAAAEVDLMIYDI